MAITEQSSKRCRRQREQIDRLSALPDSVICHILSFLETVASVRTSVLGKRWRHLWTEVPNLYFEEVKDEALIGGVLSRHKVKRINTFRLSLYNHISEDHHRQTWVTFAIDRNVQNLDLTGFDDPMLPPCLFTSKTLVDLRLDNCEFTPIAMAGAVCLPRLKKLQLFFVEYDLGDDDDTLLNLLSNCPVLEEFVYQNFVDHHFVKISSPTIKRLTIELETNCSMSCPMTAQPEFEDYYYRLEINTPAVVYLRLVDRSVQHIKCGELTSLIEADIEIDNAIKPPDDFLYSRSLVEFIDRLRDVKCLKLVFSHNTEIIDSLFSARNISFQNLTKLDLTIDCPFLSKFLENADNLEILILREVHRILKGWKEPQEVSTCLLSHLRTVKLVHFEGSDYKFDIVRYLLKNGKVLERMDLVYPGSVLEHEINIFQEISSFEKNNIFQEISSFEKGSKACEVNRINFE